MPRGNKERDRRVAAFWSNRIKAAVKAKERYTLTAEDVMRYLKSDHGDLFDSSEVREHFMNFEGAAQVSVPKVAEMLNSLGPQLHVNKPVRTVTPTSDDGVMLGLSRALEAMLNYAAREGKLAPQIRKVVSDGLIRGRMVAETVWDPLLEIVTTRYLSSKDVLIDPDVTDLQDATWIAMRQREPLWTVERRVDEKWRLGNGRFRSLVMRGEDGDDGPERYNESGETAESLRTNWIVESWIILSKMGAGFRGADMEDANWSDKDEFKKLEVVVDYEFPLFEGEWEIPYYLDRDWPVAVKDFIEPIDDLWPQSIMGQVLSLQKTLDLLTSLRVNSIKNRDRVLIAVDAKLEKKIQHRLQNGSSAEFFPIELKNAGEQIDHKIKAIDLGTGSPEGAPEREFILAMMEATTGVTPTVTGANPEAEAKDRSAAASQIKAEGTGARLADMKTKVEELLTEAARHEAITVRLMMDAEEVSRLVKFKDIRLFFVEVTLPGGVVVPVRDTRTPEEREAPEDPANPPPITLEDISPQASNYFEDPLGALQAAQQLFMEWQERIQPDPMTGMVDPMDKNAERLQGLFMQAMGDGMLDPQTQLPLSIDVGIVDATRVWMDTAGMSPDELFREMAYEIASGSGTKIDKGAEQKNADDMMQTVLPVLLQNGDYDGANQILQIRNDAYEVPQDKRVKFNPPPMMPPAPGGEGGPDEGGSDEA